MKKVVISDTSCLIILDKIGQLSLLKTMYGQVVTTETVAREFGQDLPDWINVVSPADTSMQNLLKASIDPGEASSIALALEISPSLLILDDLRARKIAASLGLTFTGTLGVIANAKKRGVIPAARPVFEQIKATDFRIPEALLAVILAELGE